jgi:16S rRNA (guanine527-N7)-methyltransferase
MELIQRYFPHLTEQQLQQLNRLPELYAQWNEQVNVISRKDIENLEERHILHSLAIAKVMQPEPGNRILDVGTGGGFPGIPLAILFPEAQFWLVDSIGKKVKVVQQVIEQLGLANATALHIRAEEAPGPFDYVVSRAVAPMETLVYWTEKLIRRGKPAGLQHGWVVLKGGDLTEELAGFKHASSLPISRWFDEPFFETKQVVYLPK